jgi:hypothetical protein
MAAEPGDHGTLELNEKYPSAWLGLIPYVTDQYERGLESDRLNATSSDSLIELDEDFQ